jgi:TRAP-type C4-dicarboxylate transport system permease small subunit
MILPIKKWTRILNRILETGVVVSGFAMIVVVIIQIISRFALPMAPAWTEEAARFFFIFTIGFAAGLAVRDHAYVNVDTILNMFSVKIQQWIQLFIHLCIIGFSAVIFIHSISLIKLGMIQRSASLHIPMSIVFSSISILSLSVFIYSCIVLVKKFRATK